jgi:hypothetical protein
MTEVLQRSAELRQRSAGLLTKARGDLARAASAVTRGRHARLTLSKAHARFETTTPPLNPPELFCPSCTTALTFQRSFIGGVSEHHPEQWDQLLCATCSREFEYRHRTRKLTAILT